MGVKPKWAKLNRKEKAKMRRKLGIKGPSNKPVDEFVPTDKVSPIRNEDKAHHVAFD